MSRRETPYFEVSKDHDRVTNRYSGPFSELAAVGGVGSVGVGTAVDGGAGGGEILPPPALGELEINKLECKYHS